MRQISAAIAFVLLGSVACGAQVTFESDETSGSGASGAAGGTGGSGGISTGGTGGISTGGSGGDCGPRPSEQFDMSLETAAGDLYSCSNFFDTETGFYELDGEVVSSAKNQITIDSCAPNADCTPMLNRLSFGVDSLTIPEGVFVHVEVRVDRPMGCSHELLIKNLPSWGGLENPVYGGEVIWLAGADGVVDALPGADYAVDAIPLGCSPNSYDDYLLRFKSQWTPQIFDVYMFADETEWHGQIDGQPVWMYMKNLRSFETGAVDDYWNWGYFLIESPDVDLGP